MQIFVVKHALDGLRLALHPEQVDQLLVVALPLHELSLLGHPGAHHKQAQVAGVEVSLLDHQAGPCADLIDAWRNQRRQRVVLLYHRLERDLPPLRQEDSLHCYWEVEDLLTDTYRDHLASLAERLQDSQASYQGLTLYRRRAGDDNLWEERGQQIAATLQEQVNSTTLQLPEWSVA